MIVSISGGDIAIRTPFNARYDLTQVLRGVRKTHSGRNEPVDFRLAGLVHTHQADIWHVDRVLAFSTDECSPFVMLGEDVGGNHGYPCGMLLEIPGHGMTCRDVGTLFADEGGMGWTLLRIESESELLFLADDLHAAAVSGALRRADGAALTPSAQHPHQQLTPAIRHIRCDVDVQRGGVWHPYTGFCEDAEGCRITEEYAVIDPRTVAAALRSGRPEGGYPCQPDIARGETMAIHRMVYHIQGNGTILCEFDHEARPGTPITLYLGVMAQEKCDAFGGGVHRMIPGIRPFEDDGRAYDFARPYNVTDGPMPGVHPVMREDWLSPDDPPNRQIDILRREDGSDAVAFVCGFLPIFDGAPEIRRNNLAEAWTIVKSRKTYPTFAGSMARPEGEGFTRLRGVAYKKYCLPEKADHEIHFDGKTYPI